MRVTRSRGRWGRDRVDVTGEEVPQPAAEGDPERDAGDGPERHATVDCHPTVAASWRPVKPSVFSSARFATMAPDRRQEGEHQCRHSATASPGPEDQRGGAEGAVVHDFHEGRSTPVRVTPKLAVLLVAFAICSSDLFAAFRSAPARSRTMMSFGPVRGTLNGFRSAPGASFSARTAPVAISVCWTPVLPMAGIAAVPTTAQTCGRRYPGPHDDGAADVLVELRQGDRAEDHLAHALKPVTREHGRLYRRTRALGYDRHRLTVDLQRGGVDPRPLRDVAVVLEHRRRLLLRDALVGPEHVVPVPAVEGRVGARESRLTLKVTVATSATTAIAAPRIADRTGVASVPDPGSKAKRRPVVAGRPIALAAAVLTTHKGRPPLERTRRSSRCGARR